MLLGQAEALEMIFQGGAFRAGDAAIQLPLVCPQPKDGQILSAYAACPMDAPGRQCVILMQAGAVSLGLFEGGQAVATKTLKKYVVRGKGKAQPTHLKTRGKSRYGSRLRLQNAQSLLEESAERLTQWWHEGGPMERVFLGVPTRLWADFQRHPLPAQLHQRAALTRIPLDLPRPTTELLLRTYRALEHGRWLPGKPC